jgi:hypothetical protein
MTVWILNKLPFLSARSPGVWTAIFAPTFAALLEEAALKGDATEVAIAPRMVKMTHNGHTEQTSTKTGLNFLDQTAVNLKHGVTRT